MLPRATIRRQLLGYFSLFLALLIGLSAFSVVQFMRAETVIEELNSRWHKGANLLQQIGDVLAEFRFAEIERFADGQTDAAKKLDDYMAVESRRSIEQSMADYLAIGWSGPHRARVGLFQVEWESYLSAHNFWKRADARALNGGSANPADQLLSEFREADDALHKIIQASHEGAAELSATAAAQAEFAVAVLTAGSVLGLALAGWLMFVIRSRISKPLGSITDALTALAAGDRDTEVPEANRRDEIGKLAQAFDVFRQNVWALEKAHEAAETAQRRALALARHDALTGLPNRRVFAEELDKGTARAKRGLAVCSVLLVDLDRFKPVNDLHGHPAGDAVLCEIAVRLRDLVRKADTVARLGGDEFAIIVESDTAEGSPDLLGQLAGRVIAAITEPVMVNGRSVDVGASIGIASCPQDGTDAESLLRAADIAMYQAKRQGRGRFQFFEHTMDADLLARAALESDVREAVARKQIEPFYQPLVELPVGRLVGFEILARWQHPKHGALSPATFIPVIEELGLISEFTYSLLRQACRDARDWPSDITLALNISPTQLRDALLPVQIMTILTETGFPPGRLEIEITETALVSDLPTAKTILTALQSVGIKVALDDFGTGFSSLYHLREMRFDKIKIDHSYIQTMGSNVESAQIVRSILSLTKSLNLPTIAEGIEDAETFRLAVEIGCDYGQGYYFGKAVPAALARSAIIKAEDAGEELRLLAAS